MTTPRSAKAKGQTRDTVAKLRKVLMQRALNSSIVSKIVDISEYTIEFNIPRFLLAFIYHCLFFTIGPLSLPIIIYTSSRGYAANMGFWCSSKVIFSLIMQYNQWLMYTT
jgi:hypothetical protein